MGFKFRELFKIAGFAKGNHGILVAKVSVQNPPEAHKSLPGVRSFA